MKETWGMRMAENPVARPTLRLGRFAMMQANTILSEDPSFSFPLSMAADAGKPLFNEFADSNVSGRSCWDAWLSGRRRWSCSHSSSVTNLILDIVLGVDLKYPGEKFRRLSVGFVLNLPIFVFPLRVSVATSLLKLDFVRTILD